MVKAQEKIFRVNIAVEQELAGSYQIQGTPTLVMFLNQNEVGRVEGPSPTAQHIIATGQADIVLLAREMLRDPYWPLRAAHVLKQQISWPKQYERARF